MSKVNPIFFFCILKIGLRSPVTLLFPSVLLTHNEPNQTWLLLTYLVSAATIGYVLASEYMELGASEEEEYGTCLQEPE